MGTKKRSRKLEMTQSISQTGLGQRGNHLNWKETELRQTGLVKTQLRRDRSKKPTHLRIVKQRAEWSDRHAMMPTWKSANPLSLLVPKWHHKTKNWLNSLISQIEYCTYLTQLGYAFVGLFILPWYLPQCTSHYPYCVLKGCYFYGHFCELCSE